MVATWGIYALLGMGIVLVYRTSRILNIAGGELAIFVGYLVAIAIEHGMPFPIAVPVGMGCGDGARPRDLLVHDQARDG